MRKPAPPIPLNPYLRRDGAAPFSGIDLLDPLRGAQPLPLPLRPVAPPKPELLTEAAAARLLALARTSVAMSFHAAALETLTELTEGAPDNAAAWREYATLLRHAARDAEADAAVARAAALPETVAPATPKMAAARLTRLAQRLRARLEKTPDEQRLGLLREILFEDPEDVAALRYLADLEERGDDTITAQQLLRRALDVAPQYREARVDYVEFLIRRREWLTAYREATALAALEPGNAAYLLMLADTAQHMERYDEARGIYEKLLAEKPDHPEYLAPYGSLLRALGRRDDAVRTYHTLLRLVPNSGAAYFGISELKGKHLGAAEAAAMAAHLEAGIVDRDSRKTMAYALGQTLERLGDYEGSFKAYALGAEICQQDVAGTPQAHVPARFEERLARHLHVFDAETMRRLARPPVPGRHTPIFIIGMPRAGSTLVEQILGSHSLVEATRELPVVPMVVRQISLSRLLVAPDVFPDRVPDYKAAELDAFGDAVLRGIGEFRSTDRPFVVDKRPWNWIDAAFLRAVLPQAKFIDIRRAPMAAGFAMFKQLLPVDASFTYDLTHLGGYYRNYVAYMDRLEEAMPGAILRVSYERLVDDTETEIRRMLDYCGLPFEERCLRFWESDRAVMTPSAEQVRRPIFRSALEQWRHYEPWLGPLREALGDLA